MSEYTPTTEYARDKYVQAMRQAFVASAGEHREEFDRMIAEVERSAAARALEEAADEIERRRNEPGLVHLDVRYAGYYTGIRSGMESDSKALRARAAEIREKGEQ